MNLRETGRVAARLAGKIVGSEELRENLSGQAAVGGFSDQNHPVWMVKKEMCLGRTRGTGKFLEKSEAVLRTSRGGGGHFKMTFLKLGQLD